MDGVYWLDSPQPTSARILARVIMTIRYLWIRNRANTFTDKFCCDLSYRFRAAQQNHGHTVLRAELTTF